MVVALAMALAACAAPPLSDDSAREELLAKSQALLDAITAGDQELFKATLDPEGLFTDEEGHVYRGSALVKEIRPLP